ncbi:MAG: hypothetical protein Q7T55_26310 [Solirubrobacteraceae bacterium]|nr:hypothetical protein [Solirubrobacteraceae bacterium]
MRLTNVAQMDLVTGRVFSYGVRAVGGPGRALPVSFDQARHVSGGDRPGSWMAIAFRLPEVDVAPETVAAAWDAVVERHHTLRTAFSFAADGAIELHEIAVEPGELSEHVVIDGQRTREVVRAVLDARCTPLSRPSHHLCLVVPPPGAPDPRPEVVIGSDHAHVDMWSLMVLSQELLSCLEDLREGRGPGSDLPSPPAFAEHTTILESMPPAPVEVHERWADIMDAGEGDMPLFPLPLGDLVPAPAEVVEVRDVLDVDGLARLDALARDRGVRLIALGLSVLTEVTADRSGRTLRAVFPVHSRNDPRWREAVGWFITNAVIESADPAPVACIAAVEEATGLGSWPLAPIFAPRGGMPSPPGMFAISWLDARRMPVPAGPDTELKYVSAAIRTDGVMIWFAVNSAGLHLRCRYPDTPEAREHVGGWLDAVEAGLRALASPGAG